MKHCAIMAYIKFSNNVHFLLLDNVTVIGGRNSDIFQFINCDVQAFITNDFNQRFTLLNASYDSVATVGRISLLPGMFCVLCQHDVVYIPQLPSFRFSYLIPPVRYFAIETSSSTDRRSFIQFPMSPRQLGTDANGNPIYPFIVYAASNNHSNRVSSSSRQNSHVSSPIESLFADLSIDDFVDASTVDHSNPAPSLNNLTTVDPIPRTSAVENSVQYSSITEIRAVQHDDNSFSECCTASENISGPYTPRTPSCSPPPSPVDD